MFYNTDGRAHPTSTAKHITTIGRVGVHPRILQYIERIGFYGIHRLGSTYKIDGELITALIER